MRGTKIFTELNADIEKLCNANIELHKHIENKTGNGWAMWSDYRKWINFNIGTLDTATQLANSNRYRDCYVLLRSVFESFLLIKISMLGRIQYFHLLPKDKIETPSDLLKRAQAAAAVDPYIVSTKLMTSKKSKKFWVEMLYTARPVDNTKEVIPTFYFFFKDYDPVSLYVSHLISRNRWAGSKWDVKQIQKTQKSIKNMYLEIKQILLFFKINKFATPRQLDAILSHYNFLSKFTHGSPVGYEEINRNGDVGYLNSINELFKEDRYNKILILLYCAFLQLYYLELQMEYFSKEPDLKLDSKKKKELLSLIKTIKAKYSFFWFLHNSPHEYDIFQYRIKRQLLSGRIPAVPYDPHPLVRLRGLDSGCSNVVLGVYKSPQILID